MAVYLGSNKIKEFYRGATKIKQIYLGASPLFVSAQPVTYYVDTSTSYVENVEPGQTVLSPQTFTPTKSGYTFVGWREDTVASGTVISSKVMEDAPITLYAVFSKAITVTKYTNGAGATATENKNQYYNNSNVANPSFTLTEPDLSGWTKYGWADAADFAVDVADGGSVTLSANKTYYALYTQNITVTYYNNSSTASTSTKARYVRAGGSWTFSNPSFTLTCASVSSWTARGWSTTNTGNAAISYNSGVAFTRDSNITLYSLYQRTVTYSYNSNGGTSGSTAATTGTAYRNASGTIINASITLANNGFIKDQYGFYKWAEDSASGTQRDPGYTYSTYTDRTMYAIWINDTYLSHFALPISIYSKKFTIIRG